MLIIKDEPHKVGTQLTFPKLMKGKITGVVILAKRTLGRGNLAGTVIARPRGCMCRAMVGDYAEDWQVDQFDDYDGEVTLKTDTKSRCVPMADLKAKAMMRRTSQMKY